jgi:hypothetical protein
VQKVTEEKAQSYIDLFYDTYPDYAEWKNETLNDYEASGHLELSDGWTMWGDNDNRRSVGNCPVQGHGAVIMRESVHLAQARGLEVIMTLHDAIYCEIESQDFNAVCALKDCMSEAFENVMKTYGKTEPIGIEGDVWSRDYETFGFPKMPDYVTTMSEYKDSKGARDLELYRKFL